MRIFTSIILLLFVSSYTYSQKTNPVKNNTTVYPSIVKTPVGFSISKPLSDAPIYKDIIGDSEEFYMNKHRDREINPNIFPPDFNNMPTDPGEQTQMGSITSDRGLEKNFAGQNSSSYPPDCNGTVGVDYYFQVVNVTYEIFNKTDGSTVAGPSNLNTIFNSNLPGANCNNGDPIVLWDEQANRWLFAEFSLCGSNDYMLIAVSTTDDPTGTWYSWSFDVDDTPDYMKFGIWQDGYYMATNTSSGNDVYVFERDVMIAGGASPTMIGFDNPNRPTTFDGFHCLLPLDNDGPWAPAGTPGQFITIADDGQSNAADELRIYELEPDWTTPVNSTFSMVQQLGVNPFSGNFSNDWNNILQPNTSQKLDGISTVLMYRAQYRNFNGTQKIVCAHTIAESSTESALRWYELERTTGNWAISQQGTYNPDNLSRWNASIAMNDAGQIGMGYSVSDGSSTYPGIRYCGQSTSVNPGVMDIAEVSIWDGSNSQTAANRWGDYSNISIDPLDGTTFWYTNEYQGSSTHGTRVASFSFPPSCTSPSVQASNYLLNTATENTLDISWDRGNGDAVIILAHKGIAVNSDPVSGNSYLANSQFGLGEEIGTDNFVIYNGSGTNVTITGLNSGTEYHFSFYEYFASDYCYLTASYDGNSTTLGPPSLTTEVVYNITGTTAQSGGNISSDNGAAVTTRGVCWNTSGSPTTSDSKTINGSGIGSFISNIVGLSPVTNYYLRAYATNSYGTAYGNEEFFTTSCGLINSFPYTQNFDTWSNSIPSANCTPDGSVSLSDCWQNVSGDNIDWDKYSGSTTSSNTGPTADYSGSGNYLYTETSSCFESTGYIKSPNFNLTSLGNAELKFYYHMYGESMGTLSVQVSTDGGSNWSADIWSLSGDQGNQWQLATVQLGAYVSSNNFVFRFKAVTGSSFTSDMAIDAISITEPCAGPSQQATAFEVTNINDNDLTVNWVRGNGTDVLVIAKQGSAVSENPITGITYTANASFGLGDNLGSGNYVIYNGLGSSVTTTSLDAGTNYHFAIFEYFASGNCYALLGLTGNETTTGAPPITYCTASGGGDEYISGVEIGTINNINTLADGYVDYTTMSTDLSVDQLVDISISNGNTYPNDDLGVWIDWNHDGDFEDADESVVCTADDGAEGTYSFSVPHTAPLVTTSMRVRIKWGGSDCGTSCGTTTYGEVEDYTINVVPASTTWNGTTTDWNDSSNWPNGIIPNSSYEVTIPASPVNGSFPLVPIGTVAHCYSLTLEDGATITVNGTLEVEK